MPRRPVQNKNVSERNPSISQAGTTGPEKMPKKQDNSREVRRNSQKARENTRKARRNSRKARESIIKARERRVAEARSLNLLSNTFMTVALDDKPACQHVLRVVTGIGDLEVREVRKQYRVAKVTSRDAVLDILAEDGNGKLYNLEIQRSETVDHARRIRFYGAMIDSEYLEKGKNYDEMPDVYLIYISETDLWKAGKTIYELKKYLTGTDTEYGDGIHVTYVNAEIDDGSEAARLMNYFKTADPEDMSQGELSNRVHFLKCEEGGYEVMCEMSEKWMAEGRAEGRAKGRAEGEKKKAKEVVMRLANHGMPPESIADIVKMNITVVKRWLEGAAVK